VAKLGFDEKFRRLWKLYLAYCEAGFAESVVDVGIYKFTEAPRNQIFRNGCRVDPSVL
jgi:cyclopropane-fatty-acyl-phospholipid synthase